MSDKEILNEIKNISKLLILINSNKITVELEKIISTDERKMIWVLFDGERTNEEISSITGASIRTIQGFRKILGEADYIENPWGKPASKKINYVPTEWISLLPENF